MKPTWASEGLFPGEGALGDLS